jgi:predicted dithiol-disulfide oxidoreductase (DUF899 family)
LLEHEKEYTRQRDRINAERRRLLTVKLEKEYTFEGENDSIKLIDLLLSEPSCELNRVQH